MVSEIYCSGDGSVRVLVQFTRLYCVMISSPHLPLPFFLPPFSPLPCSLPYFPLLSYPLLSPFLSSCSPADTEEKGSLDTEVFWFVVQTLDLTLLGMTEEEVVAMKGWVDWEKDNEVHFYNLILFYFIYFYLLVICTILTLNYLSIDFDYIVLGRSSLT